MVEGMSDTPKEGTLRDWFAGQALSGMSDDGNDWCASDYARWAYALADAMLAERSK